MKRFIVFRVKEYEAGGGMNDFYMDYESEVTAIHTLQILLKEYSWSHVYDSQENTIIDHSRSKYHAYNKI